MPLRPLNRIRKIGTAICTPQSFLVLIALLDLLLTAIHIRHRWSEAIKNELNMMAPGPFYINSLLLLLACVAIRINKSWGYVIGVAASGWAIKRIVQIWASLTEYSNSPMFSWRTVSFWWQYEITTKWDIPRLVFAILIFLYAMFLLIRVGINYIKLPQAHSIDKKQITP